MMASIDKKVVIAFVIAFAGLALTIVSLIQHQTIVAGFGALITIVFVVCVAMIERSKR